VTEVGEVDIRALSPGDASAAELLLDAELGGRRQARLGGVLDVLALDSYGARLVRRPRCTLLEDKVQPQRMLPPMSSVDITQGGSPYFRYLRGQHPRRDRLTEPVSPAPVAAHLHE
jgi:hypothetical protein